MKSPLLSILSAIILVGCSQYQEIQVIRNAATLLQTQPDSSLILLKSVNPDCLHLTRQRALYALYLSAAYDKNYIDIASDSLISIAVDYFTSKGNNREQMTTWYYNGIINLNMNSIPSAVVSFEKAAKSALKMKDKDMRYLGLIYQNIATSFYRTNNLTAATDYYSRAIKCFSASPADSLYLLHAKRSLATVYYSNADYEQSISSIETILNSGDNHFQNWAKVLYATLLLSTGNDMEGLRTFSTVPTMYLSYHDYMRIALAYDHLGYKDSSDLWINKAYSKAKNEPDSATIDFTNSKILLRRGQPQEAYRLLNHATMVQDSLTRVLLSESVSSAQRDFFKEEARQQEEQLVQTRRRDLLLGIIGLLITVLILSFLVIRSWKKDQAMKELMAQLAVNNHNVTQLSQHNASLLATHYSERIRHIDSISREYYQADNKDKKDIVFKQFKEYISVLANDNTFYESLENDLNKYCSGIMSRLRAQVPKIQGNNLKLISLFYAGLSYETVAIITKAQSINSLKTQRSRFRKLIEESSAEDKSFFLEMLEMKRQQARKTNED